MDQKRDFGHIKVKAFLSDFDGTLVKKDLLDVVCGIVGKEDESKALNLEFQSGRRKGLGALIDRINLLHGVSISQIHSKIAENDFLKPGTKKLFDYLKKEKIVTILYSGNLEAILDYYQKKLNISYVVGTKPNMKGEVIESISEDNFEEKQFKLNKIQQILGSNRINSNEVVALGDSSGDEAIFEYAGTSIAIDPKGGIEKKANYIVNSLREVIDLLK